MCSYRVHVVFPQVLQFPPSPDIMPVSELATLMLPLRVSKCVSCDGFLARSH